MTLKVPSSGPLDAKIVIIGEHPSAIDEQKLQLFHKDCSYGNILNSLLSKSGINRSECYITSILKTRPPQGDFTSLYLDGKAQTQVSPLLSESITNLHSELRRLRPNLILPLGGQSLRAITNKKGIDKWRGSILSSPFGKVVSTYNPTRLLREFTLLPIATADFKRAYKESKYAEIRPLNLTLELNPSYKRVIELLNSWLREPRPLVFDIETTKSMHIRCLGFADSPTHAVCIPFISTNRTVSTPGVIDLGPMSGDELNNHWTLEEEYEILRLLDAVFSNPQIRKIAQNAPFDCQVLWREFGFRVIGLVFDTMVGAYTLYPELPKGLDFLASLYTDIPYYSDYNYSDESLWTYNCFDCVATYQIWQRLEKELEERSAVPKDLYKVQRKEDAVGERPFISLDFYSNHLHPAMSVMTRIGQRGILIDQSVRTQLKDQYEKEMASYRAEFSRLAGKDVNPASPKQLSALFYSDLKLPVQLNHTTKKPTADEDAVEALAKKCPQHTPLFNALLHYKKRSYLVSHYLDCPLTSDGRLVTSYNAVGTVPGRCNSAETIWGEGTNLQNIPNRPFVDLLGVSFELGKPLRRMFTASPNHLLIKSDLSQAQFRIAVWDARIHRLINRYATDPNFDVHRWVASLIFNIPEADVTKSQRSTAKNGVYGGNFGMAPRKAALVYGIPLSEATFVLEAYRKAIPEIPEWWKTVQKTLNSTRTLISPLGRTRTFHDRLDDPLYRDAYAHICQAVEADVIHRACILSELILAPRGCEPVMQIHDEIVLHCPESKLQECLPILRNIMEYPVYFPEVDSPLIIPAEISYGHNWLETTKWKEPPRVSP